MKEFTFTYKGNDYFPSNHEGTSPNKGIVHSIILGEDATWDEVCDEFMGFLRAVGYCFNLDDSLTVVKHGT